MKTLQPLSNDLQAPTPNVAVPATPAAPTAETAAEAPRVTIPAIPNPPNSAAIYPEAQHGVNGSVAPYEPPKRSWELDPADLESTKQARITVTTLGSLIAAVTAYSMWGLLNSHLNGPVYNLIVGITGLQMLVGIGLLFKLNIARIAYLVICVLALLGAVSSVFRLLSHPTLILGIQATENALLIVAPLIILTRPRIKVIFR